MLVGRIPGRYCLKWPIREGPAPKEFPFLGSYGRVGNLLFHEYERGGKSVISDCKGTFKPASRSILGCKNEQKTSCFCDLLMFNRLCICSS